MPKQFAGYLVGSGSLGRVNVLQQLSDSFLSEDKIWDCWVGWTLDYAFSVWFTSVLDEDGLKLFS